MIRQLLRLLLVPLLLANQGLCFGHVHPGGGLAQPENHASRPHFHLGGHHGGSHHHQHAGHSHDEPEPDAGRQQDAGQQDAGLAAALTSVDEHDSGVVYFTGSCAGTRQTGSAGVAWTKYVAASPFGRVVDHGDRLPRPGSVRGQPASVFDAACPIYLRALSLRI